MEKYYIDGKRISRKEFISGLSLENQKKEINRDKLVINKKLIAGSLLGISIGLVIYSLNKKEEKESIQKLEPSSSDLYFGLGLAGTFISFIALMNIE